MNKTILSIDPGTRYWGITVFKGEEIIVTMVKTFKTKGPLKNRLKEVRKAFSCLTDDYLPDILVIEKPFYFWGTQSKYLEGIIREIKRLAKKEKMKIYEFSPRTVRKVICNDGNAGKKDMANIICSIYPDLKIYLNQDKRYKEKYWGHMFDSVGLGVCCLKK